MPTTCIYVVDSSISKKGKEKKEHGTSSSSNRGVEDNRRILHSCQSS